MNRLHDYAEGRRWGFPLCCTLRYSLAWHHWGQALRRGIVNPHSSNPYVPCGIFHHGTPPHHIDFGRPCDGTTH